MPSGAGRRSRRWSQIEREVRATAGPLIAGVDEVGRGPLAGPVVACAVVMPPDARAIAGVADSKQLAPAERARLATLIRRRALALGVGAASAREVDALNVYHATVLAMRRALARLTVTPHHVLVDGLPLRTLGVPHTAVVGGDACCYSIACASIVAKVTRDRLMIALARRYPAYAWERNVGYGTPAHRAGLASHGVSPHHRRSFCHARQLELALPSDAPLVEVALHDADLRIDAPRAGAWDVGATDLGAVGANESPEHAMHADPTDADAPRIDDPYADDEPRIIVCSEPSDPE